MDGLNRMLSGSFLFDGMSCIEIASALALTKPQHRRCRRGEVICTPERYQRALYLVLKGECAVFKGSGEDRVMMNTISAGGSFGVVSLFSSKSSYPSTVEVLKETELLVLTGDDVERMMAEHPKVSINLLRFLTERVEFLSNRMAELTEPTVERKLAAYLLKTWREGNGMPINLNRKRTAELLHCGRASLYRALDAMEQHQMIAWQDNDLLVIDSKCMERM